MHTSDVVKHYGTQAAVARALGIRRAAVHKWGELVPPLRAHEINRLTEGAIPFDVTLYAGTRWAALAYALGNVAV